MLKGTFWNFISSVNLYGSYKICIANMHLVKLLNEHELWIWTISLKDVLTKYLSLLT